jgi:hypothetical protein
MPVYHLVTFTFKARTSTEAITELSAALDGLSMRAGAISYSHGQDLKIRQDNADYAVTAIFHDAAAFDAYITSPEHLRIVSELVMPHLQSRSAVQFSFAPV